MITDRKTQTIDALSRLTERNREFLCDLLNHSSFEIFPSGKVINQLGIVHGRDIAVTSPQNLPVEQILRFSRDVRKRGHEVIPTLAARQIHNRSHLKTLIHQMQRDKIFSGVFVVGGDKQQAGEYGSALSLLNALRSEGAEPIQIGITGYPESHPIAKVNDIEQLQAKQEFFMWRNTGVKRDMYITTQMCFRSEPIVEWVHTIRKAGITLPLVIGLAPTLNLEQMSRFANKCKVEACEDYDPIKVIADIASQLRPDDRIRGFRFFTFNQIQKTTDILEDMAQVLAK